MNPKVSPVTKVLRCAVYTRKSTDHNLDLAFNSLDAQREACEAYIKSQAHEGWRLIPGRFDDGAFSGASLLRPALQELMDQVRARKLDIVVVYKVDRLTRSLADFAKLVELFDAHDVSFVSVTQSFNTTSSMGRLTLNVLLSFAQFEREVIGERVRDKISASKRKGLWVGGPIPLGYRSVRKKLEVAPEDAARVRYIFKSYLDVGSIAGLAVALEAEGLRPIQRTLNSGRTVGAERFMVGPLAHLLKNRFYVGDVVYRGEVNRGEHEPILERELFDAVQKRLAEQKAERKLTRSRSRAILTGLIFDDRGNPMTPSHTKKKGVRYRYYVSHALIQGRKDDSGSVARVCAPDAEAAVLEVLREKCYQGDAPDRQFVSSRIKRLTVRRDHLEIQFRSFSNDHDDPKSLEVASVPFMTHQPARKGITSGPATHVSLNSESRDTLLQAIARAHRWIEQLLSGATTSIEEIAAAENLVERHVRFLLPLAFLSPRIIMAIVDGSAPGDLTVSTLARALPHSWKAQELRLLP